MSEPTTTPSTETPPTDSGSAPSDLLGVEQTPAVEQQLKEAGLDLGPTEEEKKAEEDKKAKEAEVVAEKKKADEEAAKAEADAKAEEERKKGEVVPEEEEVTLTDEEAQAIIKKKLGKQEEPPPWEKENREPTQQEVLDYVAQRSAKILEEKQAKEQEVQEAAKTEEEKKKTAYAEAWNKEWGRQIDSLETNNYLPKVVNKDDVKDPGLVARKQLWDEAVKHNSMNLIEVYLLYIHPNKGKQPAGEKAPISHGESANPETPPEGEEFSYEDIHGKDAQEAAANVVIK